MSSSTATKMVSHPGRDHPASQGSGAGGYRWRRILVSAHFEAVASLWKNGCDQTPSPVRTKDTMQEHTTESLRGARPPKPKLPGGANTVAV